MSAVEDMTALRDVLRALRRGPHTIDEIALIANIPGWRVRRIVERLEEAGAPLVVGERPTERRPARTLHLTVDGLREWLG